jgi:hypothetical protein
LQAKHAEACRQALQPLRGEVPVRIAARTTHEIELATRRFEKGGVQLGHERLIIADGRSQRRVKSSRIISHARRLRGSH